MLDGKQHGFGKVHENFILSAWLTTLKSMINEQTRYHIVKSYNTSRLELHPGFFRMLMKGNFDAYIL